MTATTQNIPTLLASNLTQTLARLRRERADGPPGHCLERCDGCHICATERILNRLISKIPRGESND